MAAILVVGTAVCVLARDHRPFLITVQIMNIRNTPVRATPPKTPPMMAPVGVDLETELVAGRGGEFEELTPDVVVVLLGASVADNKMVYVVLCESHAQLVKLIAGYHNSTHDGLPSSVLLLLVACALFSLIRYGFNRGD